MISKLSNQELNHRLKTLVASERKTLNLILEHINEVDLRKLYLEMAYSSLYEYLVKECQYSGSAAMRRIQAARLIREIPSARQKIASGNLNLSQVSELSRAIKEKERTTGESVSLLKKTELIEVISGKTTEATQKEIAESLELELKTPEKTQFQKDESVHLSLTLTKAQYEKLMSCKNYGAKELLGKQDLSLASVIELIADQYLGKKNPTEKMQMTKAKPESKLHRKFQQMGSFSDDQSPSSTPCRTISVVKTRAKLLAQEAGVSGTVPNKTLTPKTRRLILQRDQCCQYKDPRTGKRCEGRFHLEVDHKQSRWAGGGHAAENLQILCRNHNQYKYRREGNLKNSERWGAEKSGVAHP